MREHSCLFAMNEKGKGKISDAHDHHEYDHA